MARDADLILVVVVNRYHVDMARGIMEALPRLPSAVVSLASPYYLARLRDVDAYVCAYGYLDVSQHAAARALLGHAPMLGRLPISIPGHYPYGHRVEDKFAAVPVSTRALR
jgi:beta-N-acetylhexosaminidase